jgi:dTDP-4-dehydrorhamnose reductase
MKFLLFGRNGQVGFELRRALATLGEVAAFDYPACDLSVPDSIRGIINAVAPQVIVNAAAYTAVDAAEANPQMAQAINAIAPGVMGVEAKKLGALVVHYSTDYVYDGSKATPWLETDNTNPLGVYGLTKRDGDVALAASGADHLIFRTSWVFGAYGANFVKTVMRLGTERDKLNIVADQIGAPTSAALLADLTAQVLAQKIWRNPADTPSGLFHVTAAGETSWHGFAQAILRGCMARRLTLKLKPEAVRAIPTSEYPLPAKRPLNSRLDTTRFRQAFGLSLPHWQAGLDHILDQLIVKTP